MIKHKIHFTFFLSLFFLFATAKVISFSWPQTIDEQKKFSTYFAQDRKSTFSTSLIFTEPAEVTASEDGVLLLKMNSDSENMECFSSTLGNTIILAHSNEMITVYGNLEETSIEDKISFSTGDKIGTSGSSGYQTGKSGVEFQIIDTKSKNVINPLVVMPKITQPEIMVIQEFSAYNKVGKKFEITNGSKLSAGMYSLYIKPQQNTMTYTTTVTVNGAVIENITYNLFQQKNSRLTLTGKQQYTFNQIYPEKNRQMIANVNLSKGWNTIIISISDALGNQKTATYNIEVI